MKRLSGMDAAFLYIETPAMHMHVVGTVVLDPSTMPGGYSFDTVRDTVASRLHLIPPFRRRLVPVPLGLGHPFWIDDDDFDLDRHMLRVALPPPGGMRELADLVGRFAGRPLDRTRPLWEMWVVEGLEKGQVALVAKLHHCSIDGVSGADMMVNLFDLEVGTQVVADAPWRPEHPPSQLRLLGAGLTALASRPVGIATTMAKTGLGLVRQRVVRQSQPESASDTDRVLAPSTPFNAAITSQRSVAFGRVPLDDVKAVKNATATKINDVVLAACTISLRDWLVAHDGAIDQPLVAACPMALPQAEADGERATNAMTIVTAPLPVHLVDPLEQLTFIHEHATRAKQSSQALGIDVLQGWAEYTSPNLLNAAMRVYSNLDLADRHGPLANLIVSNVPGPPVPLYTAGARVVAVYPMGPLLEGIGVNLTVLSNMGNVDFAVIACRELVPDVWSLATGFEEAVGRLRKATETAADPLGQPDQAPAVPSSNDLGP